MNLEELFPAKEIFDPDIYYGGEIYLGDNLFKVTSSELALNAYQNKKENAFINYINKYYYSFFKKHFETSSDEHRYSAVLKLCASEKTEKRCLRFSYSNYLVEMLYSSRLTGVDYGKFNDALNNYANNETLVEIARNLVRESRRRLQDVLKNGEKSEYYNNLIGDFKKRGIKYQNGTVFKKIINKGIDSYTEFLFLSNKALMNFFMTELDYTEFLKCFSYDKICLIIIYEIIKTLENTTTCNIETIRVIQKYINAVNTIRKKDHGYNPSVVINLWGLNKNYVVTLNDIIERFNKYLVENPDIIVPDINQSKVESVLKNFGYSDNDINNFDLKKKSNVLKFYELLDRMKEEQILFAKWEFFPKGEREVIETKNSYITSKHSIETEELIRRLRLTRNFIEGTNYFKVTEGIDTFSGYVAYIYPNGRVIFMRDYTKITTKYELESSAIYVMNLKDFVSLSKLSKGELIELIKKSPEYGIRRIYNYEDIERTTSRIDSFIMGDDYTEEVKLFIKRLILSGDLKKER